MSVSFRTLLPSTVWLALIALACTEGTKVRNDEPSDDVLSAGAGGGGQQLGGARSYAPYPDDAAGGVAGETGSSSGEVSSDSGGAGGVSTGIGAAGGGATGSGFAAGGGAAPVTSYPPSSVQAPTNGIGVRVVSLDVSDDRLWIWLNLEVVNHGTRPLARRRIALRYYFNRDDWSQPVAQANDSITGTFSVIDSSVANSYLEVSFDEEAGELALDELMAVQIGLHDEHWAVANASNDYSFIPNVGYCEQITAFVDGSLVWGIEPSSR